MENDIFLNIEEKISQLEQLQNTRVLQKIFRLELKHSSHVGISSLSLEIQQGEPVTKPQEVHLLLRVLYRRAQSHITLEIYLQEQR